MTIFLKFPDETTAKEVLSDYIITDEEGNESWNTSSIGWALDPLGTIYRDEVELDGWHVNYAGDLPEVAQPYIIEPNNPVRVFA